VEIAVAKTIGILGGMGPRATVDLFEIIISNTPANVDQDHLHVLINNNPQIPSRVDAFANKHANPLPALINSALALEKVGADFIIMPCHTAHIWIEELQKNTSIPFYNMIENTVSYIIENQPNTQKTILFATPTTIEKQLYQKPFQKNNLHIIIPSMSEQQIVYNSILKVKSGYIKDNPYIVSLNKILGSYKKKGVTSLLAACSEIPLLYPFLSKDIEILDPTLLLAKMAIQKALEQ
jgi:aspartate racemase